VDFNRSERLSHFAKYIVVFPVIEKRSTEIKIATEYGVIVYCKSTLFPLSTCSRKTATFLL
jgi:hypothetical protein